MSGWHPTTGSTFMTSGMKCKLFVQGITAGSLLFLLAATTFGQESGSAWNLEQLMTLMTSEAVYRIEYREEKHFSFLEQNLSSRGILLFQPPDTLVREVQAPEPVRYTITGSIMQVEEKDGGRREINLAEHQQAYVFIATFQAVLTGDLTTLKKYYRMDLEGSRSVWHLRLVPLDAEVAGLVESVVLSGSHGRVKQIRTMEQGGDFSLMILSNDES